MMRQQVVVVNVTSDRDDLVFRTHQTTDYHGSLYSVEHQYRSQWGPWGPLTSRWFAATTPCSACRSTLILSRSDFRLLAWLRASRGDSSATCVVFTYSRSYDASDTIASHRRRHTAVTGTLNHRPAQTISVNALLAIYSNLPAADATRIPNALPSEKLRHLCSIRLHWQPRLIQTSKVNGELN